MSSLILAGQIWDLQGNVRERLIVPPCAAGPARAVIDGVMVTLRPELSKALSGTAVTIQKEAHGHVLLCELLPLRGADGVVAAPRSGRSSHNRT